MKTHQDNPASKQIINIITIIAICFFMLSLNFQCGYISDDWHFNFVWETFNPTPDVQPVQSFSDIIISMKNYYNLSGGRVFCHFLTYVMMFFDKSIFNFFNTSFFAMLGCLCYIHTKGRNRSFIFTLPFIYLSLLLFLPQFGDTCLWLSGSTNYLWPTVLMLACFSAINRYACDQSTANLLLLYISAGLSSVTNETTGGMVIIFMLITFGIEKKAITVKHIPAFILSAAGMMTVLLAPGNSNRANTIEKTSIFDISRFFTTFCGYIEYLFSHCYLPILIIAFAICISIRSKKTLVEIISEHKYFITGFLGVVALTVLGFLSQRPTFLGIAPILIGAFNSIFNIIDYYRNNKQSPFETVLSIVTSTAAVLIPISVITFICRYSSLANSAIMMAAGLLALSVPLLIKKSPQSEQDELESKITAASEKIKRLFNKCSSCVLPCIVMIIMIIPSAQNTILYFNASKNYYELTDKIICAVADGSYENLINAPLPEIDEGAFYPFESSRCTLRPYQIAWIAMNYGVYIDADKYE